MKGISHFVSGVAVASFVPQLVHLAERGSFVLLLAGLGGILPDALDFKLARYFVNPDIEVDPHPQKPDPQGIAEQIAAAVDRVFQSGKPVKLQFHTIRLGADLWRRYRIWFDPDKQRVWVRIGPTITTSQITYPDTVLDLPEGQAPISCPVHRAHQAKIEIDIFSGPMLKVCPWEDGVRVIFLPWHRQWSHSLSVAAFLGGLFALILGPMYGLAFALGSIVHILEDQLGHLGCNVFYPLTKDRLGGLKLLHSGDALPNLFAVWASVVIILLNLDRFSANPVFEAWRFVGLGLVLPWAVILSLAWWRGRLRAGRDLSIGDVELAEALAEAEQVQG